MTSLPFFTNWAVGLINGYKQKENGLPNGIKYGTMGLTAFMGMFKVMANWDTPSVTKTIVYAPITPMQKLAGLFIGVPLIIGTNFCIGHHMGKAIRWAEDEHRPNKSGVKIQML